MKKIVRMTVVIMITSLLLAYNLYAMSALQKIFINATIDKWEKVDTFQGILVESGVLPDGQDLKSLVMIDRPTLFYSQTLAPEKLAGDFFLSDGQNIYAYYKRYHYGILFSGLQDLIPDSKERRTRRLSENMTSATRKFRVTLEENQKVAETTCVSYYFSPKTPPETSADNTLTSYRTWSELNYFLPLKAEFYNTRNKPVYQYTYRFFMINKPLDKDRMQTGFPPGTSTSVWDFNDPALTWSQITERMNFPVSRINGLQSLDKDWKIKKIIAARGIVPAAALLYDNGTHFLLLMQFKDYNVNPDTERGLLVSSPTPDTRLNFFGETVLLSWSTGGATFTLIGNLPYYTMLDVAGQVGRAESQLP